MKTCPKEDTISLFLSRKIKTRRDSDRRCICAFVNHSGVSGISNISLEFFGSMSYFGPVCFEFFVTTITYFTLSQLTPTNFQRQSTRLMNVRQATMQPRQSALSHLALVLALCLHFTPNNLHSAFESSPT